MVTIAPVTFGVRQIVMRRRRLVLVLDYLLVHRLNEILTADAAIKLSPEQSILKYQFGQAIKVTKADFKRIFQAFFTAIERKFL
jgi:hypothetical protein